MAQLQPILAGVVLWSALAGPGVAQDRKGKPAAGKVDEVKVADAIRKGVAFLKPQVGRLNGFNPKPADELVLLTFLHAGVPESDPDLQMLLRKVVEGKLEWTYNVSLQAMCLEELDRVKHQGRIWQCAQFLADNQCRSGQWSYGEPSSFVEGVPTGTPVRKDVATLAEKKARARGTAVDFGKREKPKVARLLPVKKNREGPATGDNSNAQYAALGLRACHDAGIVLPRGLLEAAERSWRQTQGDDGAWCYGLKMTGEAYGSMTAGALGALVIYDHIQGRPWMGDEAVVRGLDWLTKNYSIRENPRYADEGGANWHLYFLYALERFGILYGTEKIGPHEWYAEGASLLLSMQNADGSWVSKGGTGVWDTCFAILFLRRATRPMVESVDRWVPK
jgi:hypothetical protein